MIVDAEGVVRRFAAISIAAILTLAGCGKNALPSPANGPQANAAAPAADSKQLAKTADKEDVAPDAAPVPPNDSAQQTPVKAEAVSANKPTAKEEPADEKRAAPEARPERVAVLTPGGPLLVDVWITIDGRPYKEAFEARVQKVLDAGDTDGDGRPTWKEFTANEDFLKAEMPNMPASGSRQMTMLVDRYDENRNGTIERGEATSWLGRDAGTSARAFAVRSSRSYLPIPRANSQVWPLLDTDRNGRLSGEEIRGAAERLHSLDADDDRVIALPELASLREQLAAAGGQRTADNREATRYAAIHVEPDMEIDRLYYLLSDLYAPHQDLGPSSFMELSELYKKLDANDDDWLENLELADIITVEPHLELEIAFKESASGATLRARRQVPEVVLVAEPSGDRLVFAVGATRVLVSAHDLTPPEGGDENVETPANAYGSQPGGEIRLMVHDQGDALFEDIDANADGRLGEREMASCPGRLLERDANGDGQLANDELPYSMVVAFLRGERANEQSFYVPTTMVSHPGAATLPPWFAHADLNGDGDVSRREFVGASERFIALDKDQDGYISGEEAAENRVK